MHGRHAPDHHAAAESVRECLVTNMTQIADVRSFFEQFRSRIEAGPRLAHMRRFFTDAEKLLRAGDGRTEFKLLDLTGVGTDEVRHSAILAWLLNPHSRHGCRELFLHAFFGEAGLPVSDLNTERCLVRTEFVGSESVVDIVIAKTKCFLVFIENKTVSAEGERQVDREYRDMQRLGDSLQIPFDKRFAIFLTPTGRPPVSGDPRRWRRVSYQKLAESFSRLLPKIQDPKMCYFLDDLVQHYNRWS